jgi:hypothetical protein
VNGSRLDAMQQRCNFLPLVVNTYICSVITVDSTNLLRCMRVESLMQNVR